jgi:uncharacterized protein YjiS (DUF1127 family)
MAHVSTYAHASHRSVFGVLFTAVSGAYQALVAARAVEKTYAQLDALSDRELADIGLSRGSIFEAAMSGARQA